MLALHLLVLSSVPSSLASTSPGPALAQQAPASDQAVAPGSSRAWALLTSSVLFERNGYRHDLLAGAEVGAETQKKSKAILEDGWDVKKADDLLQQLQWLEHIGHRADFEKRFRELGRLSEKDIDAKVARIEDPKDRAVFKAAWTNAPRAAKLKGGVLVWDLARYVALCRWGFGAGFLTQEEAWKRIDPIARELQKAYSSWEELGEGYCIGHACWRPATNDETVKAFEKLKTSESSPWKTTPWKLKLVALDKPEKAAEPRKKS